MAKINCTHFSGYKPCGKSDECNDDCTQFQRISSQILIVHLGALGAVLRSTSLLKSIQRKYPNSEIIWLTQAPANKLLENNPLIKKVLVLDAISLLYLSNFHFDLAICIDKSLEATGILNFVKTKKIVGFKADHNAKIIPANVEANELWNLGLSNHQKFFVNNKAETQLMSEAFQLAYHRDEYEVHFTKAEHNLIAKRKSKWCEKAEIILGINTGCSNVIAEKKPDYDVLVELIQRYSSNKEVAVVLLGGPEDHDRNLALSLQTNAIYSPCTKGIRDGLCSVAACDLVFTGDSLGMHMAIALRKYVVAWFGATCSHEIDLYERGIALKSDISCSPCWKRDCSKNVKCNELIDVDEVVRAIDSFRAKRLDQMQIEI